VEAFNNHIKHMDKFYSVVKNKKEM
jgi:hypothetical protein